MHITWKLCATFWAQNIFASGRCIVLFFRSWSRYILYYAGAKFQLNPFSIWEATGLFAKMFDYAPLYIVAQKLEVFEKYL